MEHQYFCIDIQIIWYILQLINRSNIRLPIFRSEIEVLCYLLRFRDHSRDIKDASWEAKTRKAPLPSRIHSKVVLTRQLAVVRALHVLGDVFAIAGPLSTRHVKMRRLATRAEWLRHVALHRAIKANRTETIVRVHMVVVTDLGESRICRGHSSTAVFSIQGDVARTFRCETTGLVGEDVANVIWQSESRRIWIATRAGQVQWLLLPVYCRWSCALHLQESYS